MLTLIHRLYDLGIITYSYYRQLWLLLSSYGWKDKEPEEFPYEEPSWLRRTALRLLAEGMISQENAERMIGEKLEPDQLLSITKRLDLLGERRHILMGEAKKGSSKNEMNTETYEFQTDDLIEYLYVPQ